MSNNRRFALDEKRKIIDAVNAANSGKGYCYEGDPEDDKHLRESVLMVRLGEIGEETHYQSEAYGEVCHGAKKNISLATKNLTQSGRRCS